MGCVACVRDLYPGEAPVLRRRIGLRHPPASVVETQRPCTRLSDLWAERKMEQIVQFRGAGTWAHGPRPMLARFEHAAARLGVLGPRGNVSLVNWIKTTPTF
jgi:hypothetical protein